MVVVQVEGGRGESSVGLMGGVLSSLSQGKYLGRELSLVFCMWFWGFDVKGRLATLLQPCHQKQQASRPLTASLTTPPLVSGPSSRCGAVGVLKTSADLPAQEDFRLN